MQELRAEGTYDTDMAYVETAEAFNLRRKYVERDSVRQSYSMAVK
jgi:hypothetical protein